MSRIEYEKETIEVMIRLYCSGKENNRELCDSCKELLHYAHARLGRCPFGEKKPSCQHCTIHCYKLQMREKMRQVMRFSGPRMLLHSPLAALRHLWHNLFS